jgi:hypothetical protein
MIFDGRILPVAKTKQLHARRDRAVDLNPVQNANIHPLVPFRAPEHLAFRAILGLPLSTVLPKVSWGVTILEGVRRRRRARDQPAVRPTNNPLQITFLGLRKLRSPHAPLVRQLFGFQVPTKARVKFSVTCRRGWPRYRRKN